MNNSFIEKKFAFLNILLKSFSRFFDMPRLKKLSDFNFFIVEKIIVGLDKLLPFYLRFYDKMVENEIKIADISSKDNILHIGCGSIPATSIIISQKTGAKVTVIDKDFKSVKNAKSLLNKLENTEDIAIDYADGIDYPIKEFNLIIISDGIRDLDIILKNISKSMKKDAKIIIRKSIKNQDVYQIGKPYPDVNLFNVKKVVNHESYGKLTSILLEAST